MREMAGGMAGAALLLHRWTGKGLTEMLTLGQRSTGSQGESKVASGRSAFQAMAARMKLLRWGCPWCVRGTVRRPSVAVVR